MRVLIVGGGGREHALGWKIAQSPLVEQLYFVPGNPGTASLGENLHLDGLEGIVTFARKNEIDLVVVGPEQPLVDGLADQLAEVGIPCFGPTSGAARLEGSKAFSKEVMDATGVPTAGYETFTDYEAAVAHVEQCKHPLVVKADGLAAGKGVTICHDVETSKQALDEAMRQGRFGTSGERVVVEEFLEGIEASFHLICDGERFLPLITAKDHKALGDGDVGPNTGGMGTFAPNPLIDEDLAKRIQKEACEPILNYLREQGHPFRGVLFAGLMLTQDGPKVLEYNVRFGDPETQVMLPLLDFDLLPILHGAASGKLPEGSHGFKSGAATCVVLAASGYPGSARKGDEITGLGDTGDAVVFHAGTREEDSKVFTNGGRVLGLTAWADSLPAARKKAYGLVEKVTFEGRQFRTDIGAFNG